MALPGQTFTNGVSNYLFGTNTPTFNLALLTNSGVQQQLKTNGITVIRCSLADVNGVNYSDAVLDQMATACANVGAAMLAILRYSDTTFDKHAVTYLGSRCNLYELSNEPDINNITWQQYLSVWNSVIPACRAINTSAAFLGCALGVFSNVQSYLVPWLQGCKSSGVIPDGISYHVYPCTSQSQIPQATCSTYAPNIGTDGASLRSTVNGILGYNLPICCTEWNIDAYYGNQYHQSYSINNSSNAAFIQSWSTSAMESMVSNSIDMACEYELNAYLVDDSAPSTPEAQLESMSSEYSKYIGSPPPPNPGNQMADNFATSRSGSNAWSPSSTGPGWAQNTGTSTLTFNLSSQVAKLSGDTSENLLTIGAKPFYYTNIVGNVAKTSYIGSALGPIARYVSSTTYYRTIYQNNTLFLQAVVNGNVSTLGTYSFTETSGGQYKIRLQVSGMMQNTLYAKIWLASGTEPGGYQITATDTSISAPGLTGFYAKCAQSTETLKFYNFTASDPAYYPTQLTDNPYGINIVNNPGNDPTGVDMLRNAVNMGLTWVRLQSWPWSSIEKTQTSPPTYTWGPLDAAIQACNAVGMNVLLVVNHPPTWHLINPCGNPNLEIMNPGDAATFAKDLMNHYNGGTAGTIQGIEWGNEDYSKGYGNCPTGDIAATLMQNVYPAIKAIDSSVIVGGPATYIGNKLTPWWYAAFFNAGGGAYIDFLNMHTYPCPYGPYDQDQNNGNNTELQLITLLQGTAQSYGYGNLDIWITEVGWATTTTNNGCIVTQAQQSANYTGFLDICRTNQPLVAKLFWYEAGDLTANGPGAAEKFLPAYTAVQAYTQQYAKWLTNILLASINEVVNPVETISTTLLAIISASITEQWDIPDSLQTVIYSISTRNVVEAATGRESLFVEAIPIVIVSITLPNIARRDGQAPQATRRDGQFPLDKRRDGQFPPDKRRG